MQQRIIQMIHQRIIQKGRNFGKWDAHIEKIKQLKFQNKGMVHFGNTNKCIDEICKVHTWPLSWMFPWFSCRSLPKLFTFVKFLYEMVSGACSFDYNSALL